MQLNRCPVCHTRIGLDAIVQDEAGRELLGLLAKMDTDTGTALVGYLGLFRSASRDLANDRALKLAREALSLGPAGNVAQAMRQTAEQIQAKGGKPLSNHNYLKRVLEDVTVVGATSVAQGTAELNKATEVAPTKRASKTAQALQALEEFKHGR
jgi:hypothetical protein